MKHLEMFENGILIEPEFVNQFIETFNKYVATTGFVTIHTVLMDSRLLGCICEKPTDGDNEIGWTRYISTNNFRVLQGPYRFTFEVLLPTPVYLMD